MHFIPGRVLHCNNYFITLLPTILVSVSPTHQAEGWIGEKLQVANDESYRDPTNLENKLQKHQEFEAEVNANEQRIQNIAQVIQSSTCLGNRIDITQKYEQELMNVNFTL